MHSSRPDSLASFILKNIPKHSPLDRQTLDIELEGIILDLASSPAAFLRCKCRADPVVKERSEKGGREGAIFHRKALATF